MVVWTVPGPCGLHSRRYTGTSPWPTFPEDEDLRDWLRPIVAKGIRRTWIGASPFSKNRLLKTIARTPLSDPQWKGQDLDMELGHIQIRAKRIPQDRHASFPLHVQWGLQGDLSELELVADYLTSFLVSMKAPLKLAKRIIVALSNGGSIESWAKGNNTHVDKSAMPVHSAGADILARWIKEC